MNYQRTSQPERPVVPQEAKASVDIDASHCDGDEPKEHLEHGHKRGFVEHIFSGSFVDELQHFVGGDVSVSVTDGPLEPLQVHFLFDLAHHCHVRFGNHQVGSSSESKVFIDFDDVAVVGHLGEKSGVGILVDGSHPFVQIHHVLVFGEEFAELMPDYSQKRQVRAVK